MTSNSTKRKILKSKFVLKPEIPPLNFNFASLNLQNNNISHDTPPLLKRFEDKFPYGNEPGIASRQPLPNEFSVPKNDYFQMKNASNICLMKEGKHLRRKTENGRQLEPLQFKNYRRYDSSPDPVSVLDEKIVIRKLLPPVPTKPTMAKTETPLIRDLSKQALRSKTLPSLASKPPLGREYSAGSLYTS